jgi:hypothetical protein
MPGFRRGNSDAHGLGVTHFADNNNVWRLPQRGPKGGGKIRGIYPHLDLLHQAVTMDVFVFNRILDGDYVPRLTMIDQIDQSGKRGGLPRSCRPAHQHQTPG